MSKRYRNTQQLRARTKRIPLAERSIGYMPMGKPGALPSRLLDERHYERRARSLRADERADADAA